MEESCAGPGMDAGCRAGQGGSVCPACFEPSVRSFLAMSSGPSGRCPYGRGVDPRCSRRCAQSHRRGREEARAVPHSEYLRRSLERTARTAEAWMTAAGLEAFTDLEDPEVMKQAWEGLVDRQVHVRASAREVRGRSGREGVIPENPIVGAFVSTGVGHQCSWEHYQRRLPPDDHGETRPRHAGRGSPWSRKRER